MIEIKNVHKAFSDQKVLDGVDMVVQEGSSTAIIGTSGTGKSVLLKCILGLIIPDDGEIRFNEQVLDKKSRAETDFHSKIGMLFQASALFDSLTVEENVAFPLNMFTKMTKDEISDRVNFSVILNCISISYRNLLIPICILSNSLPRRAHVFDEDIVIVNIQIVTIVLPAAPLHGARYWLPSTVGMSSASCGGRSSRGSAASPWKTVMTRIISQGPAF